MLDDFEAKGDGDLKQGIDPINEELYSKEDIPSLAAAVAVYITAFSKEPFNEPWTVEKGVFDVDDIGQLTSLIIEILQTPKSIRITGDDSNQQMILPHQQEDENSEELIINTRYALSDIINAYAYAMNDSDSILLLKAGNKTFELNKQRLNWQAHEEVTAVARFTNISPTDQSSVSEQILDEVSHYLNTDDKKDLEGSLENIRTAYLGEIANLGNEIFLLEALTAYREKFKSNLPQRVIYLTKPGTGVEPEGKEGRNIKFLEVLIKQAYGQKMKIIPTKKLYKDPQGGDTIIYYYKIIEKA